MKKLFNVLLVVSSLVGAGFFVLALTSCGNGGKVLETIDLTIPREDEIVTKEGKVLDSDGYELPSIDESAQDLIRSCDNFETMYPTHEKMPKVLMREAQAYQFYEYYDRALLAYGEITDEFQKSEEYVLACDNISLIYFQRGYAFMSEKRSKEAEQMFTISMEWYAKTADTYANLAYNAPDDDKRSKFEEYSREANRRALAAQMQIAEVTGGVIPSISHMEAPGIEEGMEMPEVTVDPTVSAAKTDQAEQYLEVARKILKGQPKDFDADIPDKDLALTSLNSAAAAYEEIGAWDKAAQVYMEYLDFFPNAPDRIATLMKAAHAYEKVEKWRDAISIYQLVYSTDPSKNVDDAQFEAMYNTAQDYEILGDWKGVKTTYQVFLSSKPRDVNRLVEAMYKVGYADELAGNWDDAHQQYLATVKIFEEIRSDYTYSEDLEPETVIYPAKANFQIAESFYQQFEPIMLTMPIEVLKANFEKKNQLYQACDTLYKLLIEYDVPEFKSVSICRLGQINENFGDAFVFSEIPQEIIDNPEYVAEYRQGLEEQAKPYYSKARDYFMECFDQSQLTGVSDEWSEYAQTRLIYYYPELYVSGEDWTGLVIPSHPDAGWKVSTSVPTPGWNTYTANISSWSKPGEGMISEKDRSKLFGFNDDQEAIFMWSPYLSEYTYYVIKFSLHTRPMTRMVRISAREEYTLYVNGQMVGSDDDWKSVDTYDITPYLRIGDNAIAVEARSGKKDSYWVKMECYEPSVIDIRLPESMVSTYETYTPPPEEFAPPEEESFEETGTFEEETTSEEITPPEEETTEEAPSSEEETATEEVTPPEEGTETPPE